MAAEEQQAIRDAIRKLCAEFPDAYWRDLDGRGAYPQAFVDTLTAAATQH
jgi:acyl-CoA dehydrogenase